MAVAEVVLEVLPQPPPPRDPAVALRGLAVPKVAEYLYLASVWVGCAGLAAAMVLRRALGQDSPVTCAFLKVSVGSLVLPALVIVVCDLQLSLGMRATGFRSSLCTSAKEIQSTKMFGGLTWKVLWNHAVIVGLASFLLLLLLGAGALVLGGLLLPVEKSQREKIGYTLFDTGVLGTTAMVCFVIIPSFALNVWRR
ncbi:unnamed protein product [Urochloa decumbens]|uniref:Uncharacterized protein n=1 Tax=Urochloa decumbens TaxID=240449 RepID=A0ABC9BS74_9POAL